VRIVELHVAANDTIPIVAQQCYQGDSMSPATIQHTNVFMQSVRYFGPILTEAEVCRQVFIKVSSTKFHRNSSRGTDAQIGRRKWQNY